MCFDLGRAIRDLVVNLSDPTGRIFRALDQFHIGDLQLRWPFGDKFERVRDTSQTHLLEKNSVN